MDYGLKDKVVLITGGSTGIGKATALQFAAEGARVVVCGRSEKKLADFDKDAKACGHDIMTAVCDVTQEAQVRRLVAHVVERYGRIDVLFNNAGRSARVALHEMEETVWRDVLESNLTAVWRCTKLVVPHMIRTGGGVVVNTASFAAKIPFVDGGAYAASKSGVVAITKVFAAELAPYHIRVNALLPGKIMTEMTQKQTQDRAGYEKQCNIIGLHRWGEAAECAKAVLFLAGDSASYITGTTLEVSGGKLLVQNPDTPWSRPGDS